MFKPMEATRNGSISVSGRQYLYVLISTFATLLITAQLLPFYYETGNDVHAKIVCSGVLSGFPEGLISSYGCFVLLSNAYAWMYQLWPAVPWFDLFGIFFLSVMTAHFVLVAFFWHPTKNIFTNIVKGSVLLLLLVNLVQSEPTRTGILLTGTSMMLMYHLHLSQQGYLKIWLLLMAIAGMLIRVESGLLALALTQAYVYLAGYPKRKVFITSLPVNLFAVLLLLFINYPRNAAEQAYLDIRPYQFTLWDYHQQHEDILLDSRSDSVKLATAKRSFLADEEALSPEFFESIRLKQTDKTPDDLPNYFQNFTYQQKRMTDYFEQFILLYPSLIVGYLLFFLFILNRAVYPGIAVLNLGMFTVSLLLLAFFMKMEWRLLYPLLSLSIIILLMQPVANDRIYGPEKWFSLLILITSLSCILNMTGYYLMRKSIVQAQLRNIREQLCDLPKESVVLMDKNSIINWYGAYFQRIDYSKLPLLVPYDNGLMFIQNSHKRFLHHSYGCSTFECITKQTLSKSNVYLLSDNRRRELISNYLKEIYSIRINFKLLMSTSHTQTNRGIHEGLNIYKIFKE